jgi:hypothetical protein
MRTHDEAAVRPPVSGLAGLCRSVNRFFFHPRDSATFGLIRIGTALLVLYVHAAYTPDLYALFGANAWVDGALMQDIRTEYPVEPPMWDWVPDLNKKLAEPTAEQAKQIEAFKAKWGGYDPRLLYDRGQFVFSVWFHVSDPTWMAVVHAAVLLVMLLYALGLWTPVTGVVTWLAALSYINRGMTTLFGMDTMTNIALIYLMIGYLFTRPSARALSLDRWLWRRRLARLGAARAAAEADTSSVSVNFAVRLLQIHFCVIYLASGTSKLLGPAWWNGTAIWLTMANFAFAPMNLEYYNRLLVFLSRHRPLWEVVMTGSVVYTLVVEIGFPFLVWNRRLRWLMVLGAVGLHTGIALVMGLTGFSLMMLILLLSFVPSDVVRRLLGLAADQIPGLAPARELPPLPAAGAVGLRPR